MPEDELGKYFVQAAFAGKVSAPQRKLARVRNETGGGANPGAIGYVKKRKSMTP